MLISDIILTATRPIRSRALESALVVFAVALGVGVVTAMLSLILNGFEQERSLRDSLYAQELILVSRDQDYRGFYEAGKTNPILSIGNATDKPFKFELSDLEAVRKACPAVRYGYATQYVGVTESGQGEDSSRLNEVQLMGISKEFIEAAGLKLLAGSWPTGEDFRNRRNIVLLTEWYARQRFEKKVIGINFEQNTNAKTKENPSIQTKKSVHGELISTKKFGLKDVIGKDVSGFKIIGVFSIPGQNPQFANAQQSFGAVGITTFGIRIGQNISATQLSELKFLAQPDQFDAARDQLHTYATRRWGEGSDVRSNAAQLTDSLSTARNAALVTVLFASGGLVIAALNITNLMLARVLGRTRGIGISSALGASSRTIFGLFLAESLVLGLIGGLLGILLARGITYGLEVSLKNASPFSSGMDLTLQPLHFVIGLLTALLVSLLFGVYPAWMAARIRPSEALRG